MCPPLQVERSQKRYAGVHVAEDLIELIGFKPFPHRFIDVLCRYLGEEGMPADPSRWLRRRE